MKHYQQQPNEICFIGSNSILSAHFKELGYFVSQYGRNSKPALDFCDVSFKSVVVDIATSDEHSHYLICSGMLQSKPIVNQSASQISDSFLINAAGPIVTCELLLSNDPQARIIILGSESARKGSYDMTYALSKSSLYVYVRNKRVGPRQQLLLVLPSNVGDLGMTLRREDLDRLSGYRSSHPKKRFIHSSELALLIHNLFQSSIFVSNTEIEMNGGKFALME